MRKKTGGGGRKNAAERVRFTPPRNDTDLIGTFDRHRDISDGRSLRKTSPYLKKRQPHTLLPGVGSLGGNQMTSAAQGRPQRAPIVQLVEEEHACQVGGMP